MISTLVRISWRNIAKHRMNSTMNILGLSIGFSAFILITLYVRYEYSWDKHNANYSRIYRVQRHNIKAQNVMDGNNISPHTRAITSRFLSGNYAEIEKILLIRENYGQYFGVNNESLIYDEKGFCADPNIFEIFSYEFLEGNPKDALNEPFSIVLGEELARKLFPRGNAMGNTITIMKQKALKVTGIYRDLPLNSSLRPSYLISMSSLEQLEDIRNSWNGNCMTYILLKEGANYRETEKKIRDLFAPFPFAEDEKLVLCPLSLVFLSFNGEKDAIIILYLFQLIGIFLLILAAANFINLSVAHAIVRSKEIAIRKVHGSSRREILFQMLGEYLIISIFAAAMAFIITENILPLFNRISNKDIHFSYIHDALFVLKIFGISLFVGVLSGIYPALILSQQKIIQLFHKKIISGKDGKIGLKKFLVTTQFSISLLLMIVTMAFAMQIKYLSQKDLGFKKENLLYTKIHISGSGTTFTDIRNRILKYSEITDATLAEHLPFVSWGGWYINWEDSNLNNNLYVRANLVSEDFIRCMGIQLIKGRDFSSDYSTEASQACIINETTWKNIGWKDPIGKRIMDNQFEVIGVVADYVHKDIHNQIEPVVLMLKQDTLKGDWSFTFRIAEGKMQTARKILNSEFERIFPKDPFEFKILEDAFLHHDVMNIYGSLNRMITFFVFINILLAMIGLLGLVSFTTQRRTKEVGIRKIMGCSSQAIFYMLSMEYLRTLLIAAIISWPCAYIIYGYLPGAFKRDFEFGLFLISLLLGILIVFITSTWHTLRIARTNPVNILRYE